MASILDGDGVAVGVDGVRDVVEIMKSCRKVLYPAF